MNRTQKKHQDIIEAAVKEFQVHGFAGARTTRIAKAAGVSSRTLYNHFPSKEALFDAIVKRIVLQTGAIPSRKLDENRPLKDQLIEALSMYITIITDDEYIGLNRVMMSENLRNPASASEIYGRAEMRNNPLKQLIKEAVSAGLLRQVNEDYATEQLVAPVKSFFFWPKFLIDQDMSENQEVIIQDCVDMFLKHYQIHT